MQQVSFIWLTLVLLGFQECTMAQQNDILDKHQWEDRILLIFAANSEVKEFTAQQTIFQYHQAGLEERKLKRYHIFKDKVVDPAGKQLDSSTANQLRNRYNPDNSDFRCLLIGLDGTVKLDHRSAIDTEPLFQLIDRMPMRQREMRNDDDGGDQP